MSLRVNMSGRSTSANCGAREQSAPLTDSGARVARLDPMGCLPSWSALCYRVLCSNRGTLYPEVN